MHGTRITCAERSRASAICLQKGHPADLQKKMAHAVRLRALRELMNKHTVKALLVPTEDAHQSEYIAACHKRREFISGFTGSSGFAVITLEHAALWTDGRYFLQASQQLDSNWTLMKSGIPETPTKEDWLISNLPPTARVCIDSQLITYAAARVLKTKLESHGHTIVSLDVNLVDLVWGEDRPPLPSNPIEILPLRYAGLSFVNKVARIREEIEKKKCSALVINSLDEIAWLFNLRGSDIDFNPVFFAYAIITDKKAYLYVDENKLKHDVRQYLTELDVEWRPYNSIFNDLKIANYVTNASSAGVPVKFLVGAACNFELANCILSTGKDNLEDDRSPVVTAKAIKNEVELEGFRRCHLRDAVALCSFFAWLENELLSGNKSLTECDVADKLESLRRQGHDFVGLSFDTIAAMGPNGSIIHYKPDSQRCSLVTTDNLYLCDSGAQYKDGTTDVTRTLHFGEPTLEQRRAFTRVLQGHIALDEAVFPVGTTGYQLDILARVPLWKGGLDYRHGTGHGVGSYLNVHEGPHGIGQRIGYNETALAAGMIVTNEPGYYEDGKYGIRIENIMVVKEVKLPKNFGDRGYLGFEHITLVPMQRKLIDLSILSPSEIKWINCYHAEIREKLAPLIADSKQTLEWLLRETAPLASSEMEM